MNLWVHRFLSEGSFAGLQAMPVQELSTDWDGKLVKPALYFALAADTQALWFLARRKAKAFVHPEGQAGCFQPELWRYDVAEWFLCHPKTGAYWEFNLSPNGAWWSQGFSAPRVPDLEWGQLEGVETSAFFDSEQEEWVSMARIPWASLGPVFTHRPYHEAIIEMKLAVTAILESPEQVFLTTALNQIGDADFHRPKDFNSLSWA